VPALATCFIAVKPAFALEIVFAWALAEAMYLSITGPTYAPDVLTTEIVMALVSDFEMPVRVTDPLDDVPMYALPALVTASMRYPAASLALIVTVVVAAWVAVPTITDAAINDAATPTSARRCLVVLMVSPWVRPALNVVQFRGPGPRTARPSGP